MKVTNYFFCERCKVFHREGTLIWDEHRRYYKTIQTSIELKKEFENDAK